MDEQLAIIEQQLEQVDRLVKALGWMGKPTGNVFRAAQQSVAAGFIAEAEAEIARRGLQESYIWSLCEILEVGTIWDGPHEADNYAPGITGISMVGAFAIATATPDVRVRAMLRVLGAEV